MDNNSIQTCYLKEFLQNADSLHKMLFFNSPDAIMILNFNGLIIDVNDKISKLMGYVAEELIDKSFWGLIHKEDIASVIVQFRKTFLGEVVERGFKIMNKDMKTKHVYMTCIPIIKDKDVFGVYAILKDVTEEKRLEEAVHYSKQHDGLTSLLNRGAFEHKLNEAVQQCEVSKDCFTIMLIDINRFKFINDSLGYDIGDSVLKEVTSKLKNFFGETTIASRAVADKFLVLLKDIKNIETAKETVNAIRKLFDEPININDFELYITTTTGISIYPRDGRDTCSLMKNVEMSLNSAKSQGENSYECNNGKEENDSYNRFILGNNLRGAIERDEFIIKYQPKVDPRSNSIIGAEALVRWNHPSKGMLCPKDFLSLVEEIRLMIPLGQWVLQQVCFQIKQWEREGLASRRISINFSETQLLHKDFCTSLAKVLKDSEIDARFLEIEITEGAIKANEEKMISVLKGIKELGVHISMDDFGGGYSSLNKLRNFSVDTLKLSPAFIRDIAIDPEGIEILAAVIKLAHGLKMEVTAGGVETLEQLSILTKFSCDGLQGYLFSEPVLKDKFKSLLKIGKCYPKANVVIDDEEDFNNRRDFFRIKFKKPLGADMSIFKIGGKKVSLGYTEVVVFDISAGGLRFLSDIKLPVKSDIVLVFETEILDEELNLYGNVVWMKHYEEEIFEYGLEFVFDEKHRESMSKLLNQLQINIRNQRGVDNYRLVKRVYIKNKL